MYHPWREMAQFSQVPQIENGKPDFSPAFQKCELRNSTFFQLLPERILSRLIKSGGRSKLKLSFFPSSVI